MPSPSCTTGSLSTSDQNAAAAEASGTSNVTPMTRTAVTSVARHRSNGCPAGSASVVQLSFFPSTLAPRVTARSTVASTSGTCRSRWTCCGRSWPGHCGGTRSGAGWNAMLQPSGVSTVTHWSSSSTTFWAPVRPRQNAADTAGAGASITTVSSVPIGAGLNAPAVLLAMSDSLRRCMVVHPSMDRHGGTFPSYRVRRRSAGLEM